MFKEKNTESFWKKFFQERLLQKKVFFGLLLVVFAGLLVLFGWRRLNEKPEYIFLMSGVRDHQDFPMFQKFEEEVEKMGGKPVVLDFESEEYSAIQQINLLKNAVNRNTVCIVVNGATVNNLSEELKDYQEQGIKIISCINKVSAKLRSLHVGMIAAEDAGKYLMEEITGICDPEGSFMIVSDSAQAEFLTTLLMEVRYAYEEKKTPGLLMADIVFGNNDTELFEANLENTISEIQGLDVILCLSERATKKACAAVRNLDMEETITIIGMGSPEGMAEYMEDSSLKLKTFYHDKTLLGIGMAQIAHQLVEGEITGTVGEKILLDGKEYMIQEEKNLTKDNISAGEIYLHTEFEQAASTSFACNGWQQERF